jgi:hypothetical protein
MPFEDITFASATSAQQSSKEKNSDAQRRNRHRRLAPKQKNEKAAGQTHRVQVAHTHHPSELSTHHNSGALCFIAAPLQQLKDCWLNNLKR